MGFRDFSGGLLWPNARHSQCRPHHEFGVLGFGVVVLKCPGQHMITLQRSKLEIVLGERPPAGMCITAAEIYSDLGFRVYGLGFRV